MTTAEKVQFAEVLLFIKSQGANIVSKFLAPTPVITVDRPVSGLVDEAVMVHERVNGLWRTTYAARMAGVCVKWRDM
ncbi:hypothetical protein Tola_0718 [Tolumonas auensis DSM 9187]|uniref:Uncharacterized protein n=1 Tax=Tolumonas auensis (strain DSM 9187 / NBRC 110442 / TA 4) TaxID=595494 RepID=C4LBB1_TOLAT|nr:hypothetical protein [Tolumonas auensis]ACQ92346.1 hypothetical protein Tola_0718 [Tolumonas auensis DSM 9187]